MRPPRPFPPAHHGMPCHPESAATMVHSLGYVEPVGNLRARRLDAFVRGSNRIRGVRIWQRSEAARLMGLDACALAQAGIDLEQVVRGEL